MSRELERLFMVLTHKNRKAVVQHSGESDPVTANIGQGVFKFLVDVVGHAFDGIIHTANPAVE